MNKPISDQEARCLLVLSKQLAIVKRLEKEPTTDENLLYTLAAAQTAQQALNELQAWRDSDALLQRLMEVK